MEPHGHCWTCVFCILKYLSSWDNTFFFLLSINKVCVLRKLWKKKKKAPFYSSLFNFQHSFLPFLSCIVKLRPSNTVYLVLPYQHLLPHAPSSGGRTLPFFLRGDEEE